MARTKSSEAAKNKQGPSSTKRQTPASKSLEFGLQVRSTSSGKKSGSQTSSSKKSKATTPSKVALSKKQLSNPPQIDSSHGAYVDDDNEVSQPQTRMYLVPRSVVKRWTPISDPTKELFHSTMNSVLGVVLDGFSGVESRNEAQKHLMNLKHRMVKQLTTAVAPPVPKRRKLGFVQLSESTRKQEQNLFECHKQIRDLETELEEQKRLLEEDETHLTTYTTNMKSMETHDRTLRKKLHPVLRNFQFESSSSEVTNTTTNTTTTTTTGPAINDLEGGQEAVEDTADDSITHTYADIFEHVSHLERKMRNVQTYLSQAHQVAAVATQHHR